MPPGREGERCVQPGAGRHGDHEQGRHDHAPIAGLNVAPRRDLRRRPGTMTPCPRFLTRRRTQSPPARHPGPGTVAADRAGQGLVQGRLRLHRRGCRRRGWKLCRLKYVATPTCGDSRSTEPATRTTNPSGYPPEHHPAPSKTPRVLPGVHVESVRRGLSNQRAWLYRAAKRRSGFHVHPGSGRVQKPTPPRRRAASSSGGDYEV